MSTIAASASPGRLKPMLLHRIVRLELFTAPICAALLLMHPTPLSWPALLVGMAPSAARLLMYRRPWRATSFDLPLLLLLLGGLVGYVVALDAANAGIRLAGLASAIIIFAWVREHAAPPRAAIQSPTILLFVLIAAGVLLVHIAQPFLRLDRVPPLGLLAQILEPWGLYRLLVADPGALLRYRWYASGVGALAAVGLAFVAGLALAERRRWQQVGLGLAGLLFLSLLVTSDNRGSMVAAALSLGTLIVWWRPRLLLLAALVVFGTLDLIALGMVQRGLNLRTVVERLQFWQHGLTLTSETPWTGVGLGAKSVELTYRAAFQPTYPPFSHTHSIYVQGLLEQGMLGLLGLLTLVVALFNVARRVRQLPDSTQRGSAFAAAAGALALLTAGLTEIVALTTLGGALLAAMLGLLAAVTSDAAPAISSHPDPTGLPTAICPSTALRLPPNVRPSRRQVVVTVSILVLSGVLLSGLARPIIASPFLNLGASALYRGTFQSGLSRAEKEEALATADRWLTIATTVHPDSIAAWRNRALAAAILGRPDDARALADTALARVDPTDHDALFGIGRAYEAAQAWDKTIDAWELAGAGPQLLRLGLRLSQADDTPRLEQGLRALKSAARLGAPGRLAQDAIVQAVTRHGGTPEQALGHLTSLLDGGPVEYQTRLEFVRVYRLARRLDEAEAALTEAATVGNDAQLGLEQGLLLVAREQDAPAESALTAAVANFLEQPLALPDGDDPRFWLAAVQARQGRHEHAIITARAGLTDLPPEQASLKVPYHQLLADSLLALGRTDEAITIYQAGLRLAPGNARLTEGLARARQAAGRR